MLWRNPRTTPELLARPYFDQTRTLACRSGDVEAPRTVAFPQRESTQELLVAECLNAELGEVKQCVWNPVAATSSSTSIVHFPSRVRRLSHAA